MSGGRLLTETVAVVTGGARGIGLAVVRRFLQEGARVAIADVDGEQAAAAASLLTGQLGLEPSVVSGVQVDVSDEASLARAADEVEATFGAINCLVVNAGILVLSPTLSLEPDRWRRVLDVNLTGAFLTCRAFVPRLTGTGPRRVIFTSSLFGTRGGKENAAYSASKFGMIGLMECLAAELAAEGITVNAVCPGQVMTEMIADLARTRAALTGRSEDEVHADLLATIPLGRLADPAQIADSYVFLASDLSGYYTGQALTVDGGISVG